MGAFAVLLAAGCHGNSIGGSGSGRENNAIAAPPGAKSKSATSGNSATSDQPGRGGPPTPLGGPWIVELSREGKSFDMATLPLGAKERRPVVVAVHGADDNPHWACGGWRVGVEAYAFVACPGGLPMTDRSFGWSNTKSIETAVERALNALKQRYAAYLSDTPMIYAGFSQGAILAAPFLVENARRFPVAALAEGGYEYLTDAKFAHDYRAAGGQRILILCGTSPCFTTANHARPVLEKAGLAVVVTGDSQSGHNLNQGMQDALRREWKNLIAGLPGWDSFEKQRWPAAK
jgi:predicted esterase